MSVLMMCIGSLIIAVTPTYATIGIAAPLVLLFARLVQGLSLGGEYGTSATYLCEMAHPDHRGFYSSFQYVTLIGGQLLAMLVLLLLQRAAADAGAARCVGLAHSLLHRRRASLSSSISCAATCTRATHSSRRARWACGKARCEGFCGTRARWRSSSA